MKRLWLIIAILVAHFACAAEVMPPAPERYFNDYAQVVSGPAAHRLNEQLAQFERDTSNQIVVAIYPKLQTDSSLDDYCYRIFHTWGVGQKKLNNGAVLFVFVADHKMRIQTGYGLEGAMPDAICKRILDDEIAPYFKRKDYDDGCAAGVNAMLAAARGEYKGSGRTVQENRRSNNGNNTTVMILFWVVVVVIVMLSHLRRRRGFGYSSGGPFGGWYFDTSSGGSSGSSWGGGGGGDSGFSGGGGDSGGGGASGSW